MKKLPLIRPEDRSLLAEILKFSQKKRVRLYIVGGYLRDIFLGRRKKNPDIDFCLRRHSIAFGRSLSRQIKAGFVVLDKEHGACRLVKRIIGKVYTLDFTDFRGKDLNDDLLHRDFTMNAMCVELKQALQGGPSSGILIDPYQGRDDLKSKIVRMVFAQAFKEDPLRILRAFSFACIFGFKIEAGTKKQIKADKARLSQVSTERIRDELFKLFDRPDSFTYILELDKLKILKLILPEIEVMRNVRQGPYHHLDVWQHSLEALRQLEIVIKKLRSNRNIRDYLDEVISAERRRGALIKLGCLLHDVGKPRAMRREDGKTKFHGHERIGLEFVKTAAERLRLSNDELDSLKKMVLWHLRPGYLADNVEITLRARFRYFRDTAREGASILLISIADQRATKGPLTSQASRIRHEKVVTDLMKEYFRKEKEEKPIRLIDGNDLIRKFNLTPSPLIGKILSELEELQAIGRVKTKKEALKAARFVMDKASQGVRKA